MMRTATNVAGQALVPVIVAEREGILDRERHDSPRSEVPAGGHARLDDADARTDARTPVGAATA